jgi:S1-C subfamily serine protease
MADNDEILNGLEEGEAQKREIPSAPVASASNTSNHEKLTQLQSGNEQQTHSNTGSLGLKSQGPTFTTGTQPQTPPSPVIVKSRFGVLTTWIGIATAVVVGLMLTIIVGITLITTDSSPEETLTANEAGIAGLEGEGNAANSTDQGPPSDIPALAALITKSTVLIECTYGFGSGFILDVEPFTGVSNDRIIVTNQHVIDGCEGVNDLTVSNTAGGSKGSVVDYDTNLDLAIIDAPAITGQPLTIGQLPAIGQWAMAIGNPEGITGTVTFGNITNVKISEEEEFIFSDVLLGPGNSGGPLVDNQGKVLGINTAVLVSAEGFSFSIPIDNMCYSLLKCQ